MYGAATVCPGTPCAGTMLSHELEGAPLGLPRTHLNIKICNRTGKRFIAETVLLPESERKK